MLFVIYLMYMLAVSKSDAFESCTAANQDAPSFLIKGLYGSIQNGECTLASNIKYSTYNPVDGEVFDFIVVGSGAAGSVVANRLSENPKWKVLVLEAGGEPSFSTEIPALFYNSFRSSEDWNYLSEPESSNCLGMNEGKCTLPRGKVVGGTTSFNAMMNVRGVKSDYNSWAAAGNTGWDFESVLPYFKRIESMRAQEILKSPDFDRYHNTTGYLKVDSSYRDLKEPPSFKFYEIISAAFKNLGLGTYSDVNTGTVKPGLYRIQASLDNGVRCSASKAYIKSVEFRKNLFLSINSFVTKVLVDNGVAKGVEFINKNGTTLKVKANFEVIVSGGSYNSPKLLMLSGIGPEKHLKELGIEVIKNSSVGENHQEHSSTLGIMVKINPLPNEPPVNPLNLMFQYLTTFTGPLAQTTSHNAFVSVKNLNDPDLQFHFFYHALKDTTFLQGSLYYFNINQTYQNLFYEAVNKSALIDFYLNLLKPESKGRVLLRSKNPLDPPKVYLQMFTKPSDIVTAMAGARFIKSFCETRTMKGLGCSLVEVNVPGCPPFSLSSYTYWACHLKHLSVNLYHPVGTCKMGPRSDPTAVVDPELRVIGVQNLRVIDASIMPTIVSGNTMVPTYMIAEKGSDMIKNYWCPNGLKVC